MATSVTLGNEHMSTSNICERKRNPRRVRTEMVMNLDTYGNYLSLTKDNDQCAE